MRIAHELGRFEYEVLQMSPEEFGRWVEYLKIDDEMKRKFARRR
jgi:hypothetical protein